MGRPDVLPDIAPGPDFPAASAVAESRLARPTRWRLTRPSRVACLAWLLLAACQTYEPWPLDPEGHQAAWAGRRLDDPALRDALQRMAPDRGRSAEAFDPSDGLSLDEAQLVASVHNPDLRLARLAAGREAAEAGLAGRWDDPQIQFTLLRVRQDIPDRWVVSPALAVPIPLSDRLEAESDRAAADLEAAGWAVQEVAWQLALELETAWIHWSATRSRIDEAERLLAALQSLEATAGALAGAGEITRPEANLVRLELLALRNRAGRLAAQVLAEEQRVRALVGLSPDAPVHLLPTLSAADEEPPSPPVTQPGPADQHPALARRRAAYDAAEQALRREIAAQVPDLWIGPQYEADTGQTRIGLFGWLNLPLWNANVLPIATARAERELARADLETERERLTGRLAVTRALWSGLSSQRADLETAVLPLMEQQLADSWRLLELGEGSMLLVIESLGRLLQTRFDLIQLRADEAQALAEMRFLRGPTAPPAPPEPEGGTP